MFRQYDNVRLLCVVVGQDFDYEIDVGFIHGIAARCVSSFKNAKVRDSLNAISNICAFLIK